MKTRISAFVISLAALSGCTTTEYTLYLQDVRVDGPISHPPVPITDQNQQKPLRVTPHFSLNPATHRTLEGQIDGHSPVGANGRYLVDTTIDVTNHTVTFHERAGANAVAFSGQNLHWEQPSASFGVDLDYTFSEHWALSLGADYSAVSGSGLWGYRAGLALFSEAEKSAIRFDGGVQWQELQYEASTAVVKTTTSGSSTTQEVSFFRDRGRSTPMDFYGALTFNTKNPDWVLNIFVQAGLSKQSLAGFKPTVADPVVVFLPVPVPLQPATITQDERAEFSSTYFVLTPGLYLNADSSTRLLFGVRINLQTEIRNSSTGAAILPFLQFDLML